MIKPYYQDDYITELHGHVISVLQEMSSESIHCIVTSPPYWGLRDYGLEPQIWDAEPGCTHQWGDELSITAKVSHGQGNSTLTGGHESWGNRNGGNQGQFCQLCGAWRGSLGLEPNPELYISHIVQIWRELKRVLRKDGVCFLNLGDSYAGSGCGTNDYRTEKSISLSKPALYDGPRPQNKVPTGLKPKDLCMIPARVALALQADGWWLRSDIIWNKPNPMPESATDRPTNSHEHVFLLTKSGTSQFWTHPRKRGTRKAPLPDYVWIHKRTKLIVNYQPVSDRILRKFWIRRNLWIGHDYFYDADAVREGSIVRRPTTFRGGNTYEYTPGKSKGRESVYQEEMAETGRNLRNVWKADNIMARLRKDISNDQKQYVISELLKRGLI